MACPHKRQGDPAGKQLLPCAHPQCDEGWGAPSFFSNEKGGGMVELVREQSRNGKEFRWIRRGIGPDTSIKKLS